MARLKFSGLDEQISKLNKTMDSMSEIASKCLYKGAGSVAESVGKALDGIPVETRTTRNGNPYFGTSDHPIVGCTQSEKDQIKEYFGVAKFKKSHDAVQTSVGFTGYVSEPYETKYGQGVPTGMLVQAIEDGTEFRKAYHGIRKAIKNSDAEDAMQEQLNTEIDSINS